MRQYSQVLDAVFAAKKSLPLFNGRRTASTNSQRYSLFRPVMNFHAFSAACAFLLAGHAFA
jgi:hypothetical protein